MRTLSRLRSLWRNLTRRHQVERDLDDELRAMFDLAVHEQIAAGMAPDDARRRAALRLGSLPAIKTAIVQRRAGAGLEQLWQDTVFGARLLRRTPAFAVAAALSLGTGIGAATTMFAIVNALLLRDLPVDRPEQLIEIGRTTDRGPGFSFSYPAYARLRDENRVFTGVIAISRETIEGSAGPESRVAAARYVSGNFFETLGVTALAGRVLSPQDDRLDAPASAAVAVVAHRYWRRELGGSPSALGRTLRVDAVSFTIVGVLPPAFEDVIVGRAADFYVPIASEALIDRDSRLGEAASSWLGVAGRLQPGMTEAHAHANLAPILSAFLIDVSAGNPDPRRREAIRSQRLFLQPARRGLSDVAEDLESPVSLLMGAVILVLLIACVNVIALLLGRGVTRRHEIGLRLAIGATRTRVFRQMLIESLLLGAAGAAIGLAIATMGAPLLVRILSRSEVPLTLNVIPDARVMLFAALASVAAAVAAGAVPAMRTIRGASAGGLGGHTRTASLTRESTRSGQSLVVAQVALSLLLVVGAGLLFASLQNMRGIDAGFDPDAVLLIDLDPARVGFAGTRLRQYYRDVLAEVRTTPGVQHASLSRLTPVSGGGMERPLTSPSPDVPIDAVVAANRISDDFFATLGTPVVLGREFAAADATGDRPVAIVNEALVRTFFRGVAPIGRRIVLGDGRPREIVGVVASAKYYSLRDRETPTAYSTITEGERGSLTLAVRTAGMPLLLAGELRRRITAVAPDVPVSRVRTLAGQVERSLGSERLIARLLGAFAILSLGLASLGLYGVLGYAVARRTSEIGVRLALGATRLGVLRAILGQASLMVVTGSAIGIPAALLFSKPLGHLLYGVTPADPRVLAGSVACLFVVALAAAAAPAWRAARVDPVVALRHD